MKCTSFIFFVIFIGFSCAKPDTSKRSVEMLTSVGMQDSIFKNLLRITDKGMIENNFKDSLAFLILPVQASCPSCRKKTIDSILKYSKNLRDDRYIIISANGGREVIDLYFREQNAQLPIIENRLFLDTTNLAYRLDLYEDKPTIYYTYNRKAYKKVAAIPVTVRDDLREFFSGHRN